MKQEAFFKTDGKVLLDNENNAVKFISADIEAKRISEESMKKLLEENVNLLHWKVLWSDVEKTGEEEYDETYLAELRDEIKKAEEKQIWVLIKWEFAKPVWGGDEIINGIEAAKHTSRRIKDCKNVIGFELSGQASEAIQEGMAESLSNKHGHYLYFAEKPECPQFLPTELLSFKHD